MLLGRIEQDFVKSSSNSLLIQNNDTIIILTLQIAEKLEIERPLVIIADQCMDTSILENIFTNTLTDVLEKTQLLINAYTLNIGNNFYMDFFNGISILLHTSKFAMNNLLACYNNKNNRTVVNSAGNIVFMEWEGEHDRDTLKEINTEMVKNCCAVHKEIYEYLEVF